MLRRRDALALIGAGLAGPAWAAEPFAQAMAQLERENGERIGVTVRDTGSGRQLGWRAHERFAMCSTFKLLLAAAVLHRVDTDCERLERRIPIRKADLQITSPGTEPHVGGDLPISALCEYAVIYSDNTAANLLLKAVGGPQGVTAYVRSLGDRVTRLDHYETELNRVAPGEVHDTTTPAAMLADVETLLIGPALSPASRQRLTDWLVHNTTGDDRLRAGAPKDWRVGDKTGAWMPGGGVNDVAIFWPPGQAPILAAAYTYGAPGETMIQRNAVLAKIGQIIAAGVRPS